jgi:hypothetical protein
LPVPVQTLTSLPSALVRSLEEQLRFQADVAKVVGRWLPSGGDTAQDQAGRRQSRQELAAVRGVKHGNASQEKSSATLLLLERLRLPNREVEAGS